MDLKKSNIMATLIFPVRNKDGRKEVLLAKKVRKIGIGRPNGFGGSLNRKETPRKCAMRELRKESGLIATKEDLFFVGVMKFHNQREDGSKFDVMVFIFILSKWLGKLKLKEDEMTEPKWYKIDELPLNKMMPADINFVPQILDGKHKNELLRGEAWYGPGQRDLLKYKVRWVGRTGDVD